MTAAVTPLEALRRLHSIASTINYSDCVLDGAYNQLQGELAVAESVLRVAAAAPVVPVAAQPNYSNNSSGSNPVEFDGIKTQPAIHIPEYPQYSWVNGLIPQPDASVTDVAKDAARYAWLRDQNCFDEFGAFSPYVIQGQTQRVLYGRELDQSIDAAIAAQQGEKT